MGIIDFSKQGGIFGKIGSVVTYVTKDGKQVVRGYVKPKNPKTPKQMAHRMKFALANQALSPLQVMIKMVNPDKKNAYRAMVGKAYREAITGTYPDFRFDYGKIKLASGRLQLPSRVELRYDEGTRTATFLWDTKLADSLEPGQESDKVNIVLFDRDHPDEITLHSRFTRADGTASVTLPSHWNPATVHLWIYLTSEDRKSVSDSLHFGAKVTKS